MLLIVTLDQEMFLVPNIKLGLREEIPLDDNPRPNKPKDGILSLTKGILKGTFFKLRRILIGKLPMLR